MGVEYIALSAQIGHRRVGAQDLGRAPFEDFIKRTKKHDGGYGKRRTPGPANMRGLSDDLPDRQVHQQAITKMYKSVVMVAFQRKGIAQPIADGRFGIGIVRADRMEHQKREDQGVSERRKLQPSPSPYEERAKREYQQVLHEPIGAMSWRDRQQSPKHEISRDQGAQQSCRQSLFSD